MNWDSWDEYQEERYEYDKSNISYEAKVHPGAYLYRLTSLSHSSYEDAFSGRGTLVNGGYGRFHMPSQPTTYCSNNLLVCIAEVLFHMYNNTLSSIDSVLPAAHIRSCATALRFLSIGKLNNELDGLVFLDSQDLSVEFDPRIRGAVTVHPEASYKVFQEFNNKMRSRHKRGVIYPSARHSRDVCFALFADETKSIEPSFPVLGIDLQLVREDQELSGKVAPCNPINDKIHPTMGYFSITPRSEALFEELSGRGVVNPRRLPPRGYVDFVRRRYRVYPSDAVCECGL